MWLADKQARELTNLHGSPLYVYNRDGLAERARSLTSLSLPFGLTVRYAVKANSNEEILRLFASEGLHYDASSSYEAALLLGLGVAGDRISLSGQQPAHNLPELLASGVRYVATSMHQLELFAQTAKPGTHVALRVNTGLGSGFNNRTKTAGVSASFGLWHEYLDRALEYAAQHELVIDRLHTHIGSGVDPAIWDEALDGVLAVAARMPDVTVWDMGGGFKVHRAGKEQETNMQEVAALVGEKLIAFERQTGRRLHLEMESGMWLVAHGGCLVTEIVDIVDTGSEGFTFLRTNTGMNDFMRPAMYGSQHKIRVLNNAAEEADYIVVGHNCESSDVLTTAPGDPEAIQPQRMNKAAIGDLIVIEDTGGYCAAMCAKGYNSFPNAQEILV